jgi:hypothetical protein
LTIADAAGPDFFYLDLLVNLLKLNWLARVIIIVTEPALDRATSGGNRQTQDK